jgi:uncharacterized membrane protein YesL
MYTLDDKDLPILDQNTYVKETALALWFGLPRVMLAGVLFSLTALPALLTILVAGLVVPGIILGAITVGPGWLAMCAGIARILLREIDASLWDFPHDFGHFFRRGSLVGGLAALPLVAATGSAPLLTLDPVPTVAWVGLCADLAGLVFLAALYLYTCPQIVIYDAGFRLALRNSLVLAARHLGNTFGLISMAVLLVFLAVKISWILLVIFPAWWLVFVINNFRLVLRLESGQSGKENNS